MAASQLTQSGDLMAAAMNADMPHVRLTQLTRPNGADSNTLSAAELTLLLKEADDCVAQMKGTADVDGNMILGEHAAYERAFVAAALAIMCCRFRFESGNTNYSVATEACGKRATRAKRDVVQWVSKLRATVLRATVRARGWGEGGVHRGEVGWRGERGNSDQGWVWGGSMRNKLGSSGGAPAASARASSADTPAAAAPAAAVSRARAALTESRPELFFTACLRFDGGISCTSFSPQIPEQHVRQRGSDEREHCRCSIRRAGASLEARSEAPHTCKTCLTFAGERLTVGGACHDRTVRVLAARSSHL